VSRKLNRKKLLTMLLVTYRMWLKANQWSLRTKQFLIILSTKSLLPICTVHLENLVHLISRSQEITVVFHRNLRLFYISLKHYWSKHIVTVPLLKKIKK
ncbi:hypothetical protein PMAYCL1PPCAC_22443, partial [Pristionchus mayeri]